MLRNYGCPPVRRRRVRDDGVELAWRLLLIVTRTRRSMWVAERWGKTPTERDPWHSSHFQLVLNEFGMNGAVASYFQVYFASGTGISPHLIC
ncbi:hypothetical protein CEXT_543441 [Caerostris extrusa]|uniref:Uncharacterized protein n=1 Tax=Caerostris extrusa TaxID=172846 RepID=A0AAV4VNP4_CAEEX|nr:hypothetical protein CEXT_543441 [Caerostris extrusa]